jgi:hypothetical protein
VGGTTNRCGPPLFRSRIGDNRPSIGSFPLKPGKSDNNRAKADTESTNFRKLTRISAQLGSNLEATRAD